VKKNARELYIDIEIYRGDDNIYITRCPEYNVFANGKTQKEAIAKIKKKISAIADTSDSSHEIGPQSSLTVH